MTPHSHTHTHKHKKTFNPASVRHTESSASSYPSRDVLKSDSTLSFWEKQAIVDQFEQQKIVKETPKIGGFLADMHKQGGVMGVPSAQSDSVAQGCFFFIISVTGKKKNDGEGTF